MLNKIDYSPYFNSPEELARKVLNEYAKIQTPSFPLNPFDILDKFGIAYQFRNFKGLDGVYIVPDDENDIPVIGVNSNRPVTRQRYSVCHELCHHIKDRYLSNRNNFTCFTNSNDPVENFAEDFAGYLLMPTKELRKVADKYQENGYVSFENAIYIADYFGVSFRSIVFTLAYRLNMIDGNIEYKKLEKRITKYQPNKKRISLGIPNYDINLVKNIMDSYKEFILRDEDIVWYRFKNEFVFNENRLEGIEVSEEEVAEIVTDLRLNRQNSEYCKSEYMNFIEVAGHASLIDYIMQTCDKISAFSILKLHKMLFQFAPFPDAAGRTRNTDNRVSNAKFEPVPYQNIAMEIFELDKKVQSLINNIELYSIAEYISECVQIHHRITTIHPFNDGNGRVSRIFLNWLMRLKHLPPVYIKHEYKQSYYNALEVADTIGDFKDLNLVFYKQVIQSMILLDKRYVI